MVANKWVCMQETGAQGVSPLIQRALLSPPFKFRNPLPDFDTATLSLPSEWLDAFSRIPGMRRGSGEKKRASALHDFVSAMRKMRSCFLVTHTREAMKLVQRERTRDESLEASVSIYE